MGMSSAGPSATSGDGLQSTGLCLRNDEATKEDGAQNQEPRGNNEFTALSHLFKLQATSFSQSNFSTMVLLVTSDNEQFVVDKEVAERSVLIKNMLEGTYASRRLVDAT